MKMLDELQRQEETLRQGGGATGHERQKKLGRFSVRKRLELLLDKEGSFLELGLWAAWGMYEEVGEVPAAGVVTGVGEIHGRPCMVIANDATVKAGAFFPATVKKVLRAQKIATRCNLPVIYLVDSAGVYLPMQDEVFPDEDDFGRIFRNNAVMSAMGIPQYAAIMGNCVAGGAYLPVLCDKVLMTEGSKLYLAGPALVKAAIGQEVEEEALGGAKMHAQVSGTVDFLEKDETSCLKRLRALVDLLPAETSKAKVESKAIHTGDVHELLGGIVDQGTFEEYKAEFGKTLVCGYARMGGIAVGIVANQYAQCRSAREGMQIGGVIYHDSADKAARFVMNCSQSELPLVFLQDVHGFMVGRDSEEQGIIRSGAKLVNAVSNATVPKITMITGGSFGAGNYALCGKAFDPCFVFAWPQAKYAVMGAMQAADTLMALRRKQPGEEESDELRQTIRRQYERQMDIRYGAARGWVDAIIRPEETRATLITALRLATRPAAKGGFRAGIIQ